MTRPSLVFYCQHSLGLGHLARSWALADALSSRFRVALWCGGPLPQHPAPPRACEIVALPPIVSTDDGRLVSVESDDSVDALLDLRRDIMLRRLAVERPAAIVVELFPFGRRKFTRELLPLLDVARAMSPRPLVVCSVRDILVGRGEKQQEHDERARMLADRYFDAVLVHGDPAFARFDDFFRPLEPMRTPVHYTGFVAGAARRRPASRRNGILVSGGGGRFAASLFMTAIDVHGRLKPSIPLTIVAGPFCEESTWQQLVAAARSVPSIRVRRTVTDLCSEMAESQLSISQCGYNTALEIVQARVPALVVPFAERGETEQTDRARRLAALGLVRMLAADRLNATTLAAAVEKTMAFQPAAIALDVNGRDRTTRLLTAMVDGARGFSRAGAATHHP
jgi:predicted glycosyltransferase